MAGINLILPVFTLVQPFVTGRPVNAMAVVSNLFMGALVLSMAWTRRFGYHAVVSVLLSVLIVVEIALKF